MLTDRLVAALLPFADQAVSDDSLCHKGLRPKEECVRCRPILAARAAVAEATAELKGREILKGTGDVLKDLAYAQRYMDGFAESGLPGRLGLEVQFVERAMRVAIAEIKSLRERVSGKASTKVADL